MRTVRLPKGIVEVLELDDPARWKLSRRETSRHVYITADDETLQQITALADARSALGWDQPAWYYRTARATYSILKESGGGQP